MSKKFIDTMISEMRSAYQISGPGTREDVTEAVTRLARDKTLNKSRNWRTRRVQESINTRDRSKRVCPPGYEYDPSRKDCVPVRGGVSGGRLSGGNRDDAAGTFTGRVYGSHGQNGEPPAWEERPRGGGWSDQFNGESGFNQIQIGEEKTCGNCKKRKCSCKTFRNFTNPYSLMHHMTQVDSVGDARDDYEGEGDGDGGMTEGMVGQSAVSNYTTPARPKMPSGGYTQRSDNRGPTAGRDAPMGRVRNPRRKQRISESRCPRCLSSNCRCLGNRALID